MKRPFYCSCRKGIAGTSMGAYRGDMDERISQDINERTSQGHGWKGIMGISTGRDHGNINGKASWEYHMRQERKIDG